jgi:drug/metabolite transporter (DMT)-like permease
MQALVVSLILAPLAGEATRQLATLPAAGLWRLAYLALAGSVIAPTLQVVAQRTLAPGRIGLLFALEPVFALIFAVTVGGERFGGRWWAGAALILLAVWSVERRSSRDPEASPAPSA